MENIVLDQIGQIAALFKPFRLELLSMLDEPRTCGQLAETFHSSPQKIYYHLKILERAGLVKKVSERRVRGIMEGYYRAAADSYFLSPKLVDQLGGEQGSREQMSLGYLLGLADQIQSEVIPLMKSEADIHSLGMSAHINLRDDSVRADFLEQLQGVIQGLAEKYSSRFDNGGEEGETDFRLIVACYPKMDEV